MRLSSKLPSLSVKDHLWPETGSSAILAQDEAGLQGHGYHPSDEDPCLYHCWHEGHLVVWITWVNDCKVASYPDSAHQAKLDMMNCFNCNKIDRMNKHLKTKKFALVIHAR